MRLENSPRFDDTMTGQNIQALIFQADSFKELRDLNGGLAGDVSLKQPASDLPIAERGISIDAGPGVVEELMPSSTEQIAGGAAAPDNHAVRRTAMFERRRRRNTRGRRAMRARGAPRLCIF